jgi:regulator of protease activity HflC (stomatin/prohibitin superfamily)
MIFWKTIDIADNERALLYRRNRLLGVLTPGRHCVLRLAGSTRVEVYDISDVVFSEPRAKFLMNSRGELLDQHIERFEMGDNEVGLFYRDGHLKDVLAPGSFMAVWRNVERVRVDVIDISGNCEVDPALLTSLNYRLSPDRGRIASRSIKFCEVGDGHVGMLSVDGKYQRMLAPGSYGFWTYNRNVVVGVLDMRLQTIEVSGQEILTKDRVSLRINLSGSYKILEPETVNARLADYADFIYRELQLRLREVVGTHTLDSLLEDKDRLNLAIAEGVRARMAEYGIEVTSVGVKDIILPGDMKLILNQVVEAQKESEANLIKRREETQAMRSLHNTAKMMENNPTLMRLKELEALERVTARIDKISVYGGLDGVLNDLVTLGSREVNR